MRLYHFSEEPGIGLFVPRPPEARPEMEPLIWAVDEEHAATYLFPRDCPRILLWPTEATSAEDRERWWGDRDASFIACVEWEWFERLRDGRLYRYVMPAESFVPLPDDPWMWVSRAAVEPLAVEPVGDLVAALATARVELRIMPSLRPLWGVWESTLHFSGIRLRNSRTWPQAELRPPG